MFFDLPQEIIRLIYSYDCTYKLEFDKVLENIQRYTIYQNASIYCIYNQHSQIMHSTDSLVRPKWICSTFNITKQKMEKTIHDIHLFRNRKDSLEYDIEQYEFVENDRFYSLF